jgi:hypothetical protein
MWLMSHAPLAPGSNNLRSRSCSHLRLCAIRHDTDAVDDGDDDDATVFLLQPYDFSKKLERGLKMVRLAKSRPDISAVDVPHYATRFRALVDAAFRCRNRGNSDASNGHNA